VESRAPSSRDHGNGSHGDTATAPTVGTGQRVSKVPKNPAGTLSAGQLLIGGDQRMDTATLRSPGGCSVFGVAVVAAILATVWWGLTALLSENFGGDCLFYFGDTGPRAENCYLVNDRAETWLPQLVYAAWTSAVLVLFLPRRFLAGRRIAAGVTVACLIVTVVLGSHALVVSSP